MSTIRQKRLKSLFLGNIRKWRVREKLTDLRLDANHADLSFFLDNSLKPFKSRIFFLKISQTRQTCVHSLTYTKKAT